MKHLILITALLTACGTDSKDSGTNLVSAEPETKTTEPAPVPTVEETPEPEPVDTFDPDAYPIAEGYTKIAVSSFKPVPPGSWELSFVVDFQCPGTIEFRAEWINAGSIYWNVYISPSQPDNWINGYRFTQMEPNQGGTMENVEGYNPQSRVLYKCLGE